MDVRAPSRLSRLIRFTGIALAGMALVAVAYGILWLILVELSVSLRSA